MRKTTATRFTRRGLMAGAAAAALLAGCGADQVAGIQGSGAPVAASVSAVGPVDAFGSVFVDGVEYATSGAQIRIDDQTGVESQLRVGQIVTIRGTVDANGTTGTATMLSYSDDLRGPIEQIDTSAGTFALLGTTVSVTDATVFGSDISSGSLAGLQVGDVVQVSGFAGASGGLIASRVDLATSAVSLQIRGTVQALDTFAQTFHINMLTVNYGNVTPSGTLANGSVVTVEGTAPSGVLMASRVQVAAGLGAAANDAGRIAGAITSFTSAADFSVSGQRVTTNASTQIVPANATLGLDAIVKVRGTFDASGVLVASRVQVQPRSLSIVGGPVSAVPSSNTLTVLGVTVTVDATTSYDDRSSQPIRLFQFSDLHTGDYVEARGTASASGGLAASQIARKQSLAQATLQGTVTGVANPSFTVLGVAVMTTAQTHFVGLGGQASAAAAFFDQALNKTVKVTLSDGVSGTADRVQLLE